ncbi:MAG: peptide deformylase [Candidatus Paceibacterota bacterium]|jgi:peptide deformylase|nr:peptide deformylase [Candidatus Paceibacterota bacterium]
MVKIVQQKDPVLRKEVKLVPRHEITSAPIQKILADMKTALASQEDGVAIAAPQIGVSLAIFVMSGKAVLYENAKKHGSENVEKVMPPDVVFINPEIIKISKKRVSVPEGCLSVRWLYGQTLRAEKARVQAYNEEGKLFEYGGSGLIAQIFQHETDHLKGILFIDHATDIQEMPPETK